MSGTAGAGVAGNSVVVLHQPHTVGSDTDDNLKLAVEWVNGCRTATPAGERDGVIVKPIDTPLIGANASNDLFFRDFIATLDQAGRDVGGQAGKALQPSTLDAVWSKLPPGHTLVLLMHGTTDKKANVGGVKLFDDHAENAVVLDDAHLGRMGVEAGKVRLTDPNLDDPEGEERVPLVQALRDSVFQRIVLLACGTASRLKTFAPRLAKLTGKVVHFNDPHPVWVDFKLPGKTDPKAHVGAGPTTAASGKAWVPAAAAVKLDSTPATFLPGSTDLAQP